MSPTVSRSALATLSLLSELARERPLVCVVDDAQWLDQASAQALAFVARHLAAAPAAVIFAVRQPGRPAGPGRAAGVPARRAGRRRRADAARLGADRPAGRAGTRPDRGRGPGQPPGAARAAARADARGTWPAGSACPRAVPVPSRIEEDYRRQLALLPAATQLLLLIAAAEPAGDPVLVWRAAGHLGVQAEAAEPAAAAGLAEFSGQVRFCHPQARAAIYRAAAPRQRQRVHRALAETADSEVSPDQRAWHRAHATPHLDEDVAAELDPVGRPGARPRRPGRRGRVRRTRRRADARASPPGPPRAGRGAGQAGRPVRRTRRGGCWPWRRAGRWMNSGGRGRSCCTPSWRPARAVVATDGCSCSTRPGDWNRSMPGWPARPTARRSAPR